MSVLPVIMCGGSGTRLWPLSRKSLPKQFVPLFDNKSLFSSTLERLALLSQEVLLVGSEEHRFLLSNFMRATGVVGDVILEPVGRDTAAAMTLAAMAVADDQLLVFCPADHFVPDAQLFVQTVQQGVAAAESGAIVVFGVQPSAPATCYGYIEKAQPLPDGSHQVARFVEKPDSNSAQSLLLKGALWNAGVFLVKAGVLLAAIRQHAQDIYAACLDAFAAKHVELIDTDLACRFIRPDAALFTDCRAQSIDYAVIEKHHKVVVVPFIGQWSDVGSWNAIKDMYDADEQGNVVVGKAVAESSTRTFIHAQDRLIVAMGVSDLLIVDTPDALLVTNINNAEQIKQLVSRLQDDDIVQATSHQMVYRPWGWYDSIDFGVRFQVKRIGVNPGAALSLQKHFHRAEHWVVVCGTAEVTCDDKTFILNENQSTYIPLGAVHRLRNPSTDMLEIIEVQSGDYLGEDDIVRLDDNYGRTDDT